MWQSLYPFMISLHSPTHCQSLQSSIHCGICVQVINVNVAISRIGFVGTEAKQVYALSNIHGLQVPKDACSCTICLRVCADTSVRARVCACIWLCACTHAHALSHADAEQCRKLWDLGAEELLVDVNDMRPACATAAAMDFDYLIDCKYHAATDRLLLVAGADRCGCSHFPPHSPSLSRCCLPLRLPPPLPRSDSEEDVKALYPIPVVVIA